MGRALPPLPHMLLWFVPEKLNIFSSMCVCVYIHIGMRHITMFWSTMDRIYDGGPVRL